MSDLMFLAVITRWKDEAIIEEFVRYYLDEGADHIFIFDDGLDSGLPADITSKSEITALRTRGFRNSQSQLDDVNKLVNDLRQQVEWIVFVDCDEFIAPRLNQNENLRNIIKNNFHLLLNHLVNATKEK